MSLHPPSILRETWKLLDQGILPAHLGGTGPDILNNPSSATTNTMSSSSKTNVAVIGYGLSAKIFHIPLILALPEYYNLYGVVQRSPTPTDDAAKDHAGIKTWKSVDDMLADKSVDLVVVSSTPGTHYEFTLKALNAGKHLVVEKPFMPTSAEARELATLAKEKNLLLSVYQNRRWDVDFLTLKQLLAEGTLGDVAEFETHFDRFRPEAPAADKLTWKNQALPAGGALYDLGSHLIDQVYALFGAPKSVWGLVQVQKRGLKMGETAPDACTVVLRYGSEEDEMLVTVKSSSVSAGDTLRYWVRGTKGAFRKVCSISASGDITLQTNDRLTLRAQNHLDPQEDQLKAGQRPGDKDFAYEDESRHGKSQQEQWGDSANHQNLQAPSCCLLRTVPSARKLTLPSSRRHMSSTTASWPRH